MAHLLHIDSSISGEHSVSRALSARAAERWREAHPGGIVTYRDIGADPIPHFDSRTGLARLIPQQDRTAHQAESWALTELLIQEVAAADTIVLGLPVYNFGAPSSVKAWVDHLVAPGLSIDESNEGLLTGKDFLVVESRGGGYGPGTPKEGWDHAQGWLPHGVAMIGLEPRFITAELTLANTNPALAQFKDLAAASLAAAESEIDAQWRAAVPA